jgi:predicted ATPase/DNA-binding XRE family transcriptional regulator
MTTTQARGAFGLLLRQHRAAAGLSQEELADRAGVSRRAISDLERGVHRTPYPATARQLARALGLDATAQVALLAAGRVIAVAGSAVTRIEGRGLPRPLSSLVGRERELGDLSQWLLDNRLVTLTGPGGVGKTRLALEVARSATKETVFVDLASLQRAAIVAETVATALGIIASTGDDLLASMARALAGRNVLLVLDNCEHVVGACAELAERLLPECPTLQILATSRERFGIAGEAVWPVAPLEVSDPSERLSPEMLEGVPSARLFIERARLSGLPDFGVTQSNASRVAEICYRLEGIPLALELAAARVHILGVVELAGRLDESLTLLSIGMRVGSARHPTLRATLDWSYNLLSESERTLFERLAVFAGGWTLEAAEEVCAAADITPDAILDLLGQLIDRSMVTVDSDPPQPTRFRLLEPIRQYALERLLDRDDASDVRRRHSAWFGALAEYADLELWGPDQVVWLERMAAELGNLRAALEWSATGAGDAEMGLRLASALWWFWSRAGHVKEGYAYLSRMLELYQEPTAFRAWGLLAASNVAWWFGDLVPVRSYAEQGLKLATLLGHARTLVMTNIGIASCALAERDFASAERYVEQALLHGDEISDPVGVYIALLTLGQAKRFQGRFAHAERLFEDALVLIRAHGDHAGIGAGLYGLAQVALARGDHDRARALQLKSLAIRQSVGDVIGVTQCLDHFAMAATGAGALVQAARLFGAAEALRVPTGGGAFLMVIADQERAVAAAREGLGDADFDAAWTAGSRMSMAEAVAEAGQSLGGSEPSDPGLSN